MVDGELDPVRMFASLRAHGVRYVVVGGLAAIAHGISTSTDEADICVDGAGDNLDRLALALEQLGARPAGPDGPGGEGRESFATVAGRLDCIEVTPDAFEEILAGGAEVDVGRGVTAWVASIESLASLSREAGDLTGSVRIAAMTDESGIVHVGEADELSREEAPPTRARDKLWRRLEDVDRFLTKLVDR